MAIAFACPSCGKKFKVEDGMAGRKGKCPGCDTTFQIPGVAPAPRTVVPTKTAPSRRPVDDDDEGPPPPRVRPEGRRPPHDEKEKDRARDEDRPRRGLVDEDERDEEEDDRPRRRRRKKKQKSATGLIIGIVAGALGLLAVAGVSIWLLTRSGGSGGVADDLKYLPDHCETFFTFNIESLTTSDLYKRLGQETAVLKEADQQILQGLALSMADLQRITTGGSFSGGSGITVYRCKKPITLNEVLAKSSGKYNQEATFGGHAVRHDSLTVICVPEANTVVMGPYVAMSRALERKGTKAKLSPTLQTAFNDLDLSKVIAGAMDLSRSGDGEQPGRGRGGIQMPPIPGLQSLPEAVSGTVELGESATLTLVGTCTSPEAAEALKKQLEAFVAIAKGPIIPPNIPREVTEIAKRIQMNVSGNRLTATLTVEIGLLIEAAKKMPASPGG